MINIYGHFGSHNHGNEAIIRGLSSCFMDTDFNLFSYFPDTDRNFELNSLCNILPFYNPIKRYSFFHFYIYFLKYLLNTNIIQSQYIFKPFLNWPKEGVFLLEAGDQYCEGKALREKYAFLNKEIHKAGGKTVMLPCTIDVNDIDDIDLLNDLTTYDYIFARETITYHGLLRKGLRNVFFSPCPAFKMKSKFWNVPKDITSESTIGITVGKLAQGNEQFNDILSDQIEELIKFIIKNTRYNIALIPHVNVSETLNDYDTLRSLYHKFKHTKRIIEINERRADEQKYTISKCRMLITTRTHASIAAYSSNVPALVIGYSQKSKGIAKDLFGSYDNFIVEVDKLTKVDTLKNAFICMDNNCLEIKEFLEQVMPNYIEKTKVLYETISQL